MHNNLPFTTYTKYKEQYDKFILKAVFMYRGQSTICYKQAAGLTSEYIITKGGKKQKKNTPLQLNCNNQGYTNLIQNNT